MKKIELSGKYFFNLLMHCNEVNLSEEKSRELQNVTYSLSGVVININQLKVIRFIDVMELFYILYLIFYMN